VSNCVPDEGTGRERVVVVSETPLVGTARAPLINWWRSVGLSRRDLYITSVVPYVISDVTKLGQADLNHWTNQLHEKLATLGDPWVLVPLGDPKYGQGSLALAALTGKKAILKHRGSIYEYQDRRGRGIKVIPTLYPGVVHREPRYAKRCLRDWTRIADDSGFRELRLPEREHYIRPSYEDVCHYVSLVASEAEDLALDIETPGGIWTCIGFSHCPEFSITIPLTRAYWGDRVSNVWNRVCELLMSPVPKVMQNGLFDMYYIRWHDLDVVNWQWDTLAMHHALDPVDEHSLAYMASLDTREPYWKDEAKDPDEMARYARHDDAFWKYNGKDVAVTLELKQVYHERMVNDGGCIRTGIQGGLERSRGEDADQTEGEHYYDKLRFYQRHYRDIFLPLLGMSLAGIRVDEGRRHTRHDILERESRECLENLALLAGE